MTANTKGEVQPWGFHAMVLTSGVSAGETASLRDLIELMTSDDSLTQWAASSPCYRVVQRGDVDAVARRLRDEAQLQASEEAATTADAEPAGEEVTKEPAMNATGESAAPGGGDGDGDGAFTPGELACAFQRLVADDKLAFLAAAPRLLASADPVPSSTPAVENPDVQEPEVGAKSPAMAGASPACIYLLVEYPATVEEAHALLLLGELDQSHDCDASRGDRPLLPLLDGLVLLLDPAQELRERRKSVSQQAEGRRRSSVTKRVGADTDTATGGAIATDMDRPPSAVNAFQHAKSTLVRELYERASVGGLEWSDFIFTDVPCCSSTTDAMPASDVLRAVATAVETGARQKAVFKDWVSNVCIVPWPIKRKHEQEQQREMLTAYHSVLHAVFPPSVSVAVVLFAMQEAVATVLTPEQSFDKEENHPRVLDHNNQCQHDDTLGPCPDPFIDHGDDAAMRLALSYAQFIRFPGDMTEQNADVSEEEEDEQQIDDRDAGDNDDDDSITDEGESGNEADDSNEADTSLHQSHDPCRLASGMRIDRLEKLLWQRTDLPGVGNCGRRAFPRQPQIPVADRSIQDTEFGSTFATMPVAHVHLLRQLLRFEQMLGTPWRERVRYRECIQILDQHVLPQRLAMVLRDDPVVYTDYYEPTDSLLIATLTATAPGRFRTTTWSARDHVRHRPAFKDWKREIPLPEEYLTPRTAAASGACVPLSAGELSAVSEKCSIVYPADQSLVKLYQRPCGSAWVSVALHGDLFGLRPCPSTGSSAAEPDRVEMKYATQFYANFRDQSLLHVRAGPQLPKKPDGHGSVAVTQTLTDGLLITTYSDGHILQRRQRGDDSYGTPSSLKRDDTSNPTGRTVHERFRVISGNGSVQCELSDGSRRTLHADGNVETTWPNKGALVGGDTSNESGGEDEDEVTSRELIVDPETNALVARRTDGSSIVVTHTDGARITYHRDGTRIVTTATRSHVLVTKPGFADVCIDVDVNVTAARHAAGEKVAVTKGGLRTRSIVRAVDGTQVELRYNTKVVAQVNGQIVTIKPSGAVIVAKESGRVEYHPTKPADDNAQKQQQQQQHLRQLPRQPSEDDDRDVLSHNSVYYFDCRDGTFSLCDHEENQFALTVEDGQGLANVSVQLAGVLSNADIERFEVAPIPAKAVTNDPITPHLFVLDGKGNGVEILRPRDWEDLLAASKRSQNGSDTNRSHHEQRVEEVTAPPPPEWSMPNGAEHRHERTSAPWTYERIFLCELSAGAAVPKQPWFQDARLNTEFERHRWPVATAAKLLEQQQQTWQWPQRQQRQVDIRSTVVRRVQQLRPVTSVQIEEMLATLSAWHEWQKMREANKDRFKADDPRNPELIAQETALQRKVLAAYKAARAHKKLERQKLKEQQRESGGDGNGSGGTSDAHMETVPEGDEPQAERDAQNDALEEDHFMDDDSDGNSSDDGKDEKRDSLDELLWSAFSQADAATGGGGRLAFAQVRRALVQVLGVGVPAADLSTRLQILREPKPFAVAFEVFVELVHAFRGNATGSQSHNSSSSQFLDSSASASSWGSADTHGNNGNQLEDESRPPIVAAGSAADAVRSFSLRLNPPTN